MRHTSFVKAICCIALIKYLGLLDAAPLIPLLLSLILTSDIDLCLEALVVVSWNVSCRDARIARCIRAEVNLTISHTVAPVGSPEAVFKDRAKSLSRCVMSLVLARAELTGAARHKNLLGCHLHICSENNFPTGAGLASSAAGYACLVFTLAKLVGLEGDISGIARLGSGSACRSVLGGFVHWHKGSSPTGCDSVATQMVPASHWPELRIVILVVNSKQKMMGSSLGMKRTVETSELLRYRIAESVPSRINSIEEAIREKNFRKFGELTMKDSNQFHAVCVDSFPPLFYMNDASHAIVNFVHMYNGTDVQVAYTFDAGSNACLFVLEENLSNLLATISYVFPPGNDSVEYLRGMPVTIPHVDKSDLKLGMEPKEAGLLKHLIVTRLGTGPQVVEDHLLTTAGDPKHLARETTLGTPWV
ncbi:hypothetical protein PR048_021944 [Dryococelus australis]|uniref:Diphosphomevalonate decarboxylase n=1 Tax=Dryococelus australis TaxID=614101 RepID=A0ABQ9GZL9_9NEOP|nr:hypothetical protein PR048_021944 [Dryococelus australis]